MKIGKKGLVLAMEGDDNVDAPVADMEEVMEGSEEAMDEVSDGEETVAELEDAADSAEADAETLDRIKDTMEKSVEDGEGLSEDAAAIAEVAVEAICDRLGISNKRIVPSLESFGSTGSRVTATKIAVEGIKETIARVWEAIRAAIVSVWNKIKDFLSNLSKNSKKILGHLEALKERAGGIDGGFVPEEKELKKASLARGFSIKKKANAQTALTVISNSSILLKSAGDITGNISKTAAALAGIVKQNSEDLSKVHEANASFAKSVSGSLSSLEKVATQQGVVKADKKSSTTYYGPLAGTKVIAVTEEVTDDTTRVNIAFETYPKIEAEVIKAMTKSETISVLDKAITLLDELTSYEKTSKSIDEVNKTLIKSTDAVLAIVKKASEDDTVAYRGIRAIESNIKSLNSMTSKMGLSVPVCALQAAKYAGEYASASMSNLKAKK